MYRSIKYKLRPTITQATKLSQIAGANRWLWNYMLALNIAQYKKSQTFIWAFDLIKLLPNLKREHEWLNDSPAQSLQQRCIDLQHALKMASSKRTKQFGFPKFKSKKYSIDSFRIPQTNSHITTRRTSIKIPKLGWIKCIRHKPLPGKLINVTIKKEQNVWYAVVLCELPDRQEILFDKTQSVGLDLGLKTFAVLSNGTQIQTPKFYRNNQNKLARANRNLSRKQKGSKNREKARLRLAKIHKKIRNQRHNFIHQESRKIANYYLGVFIEDLNIEPIKKRYGKSVTDQGWTGFANALSYKCNHLSKIDRFAPSSKVCNKCGNKHEMNLSVREIPCCGIDRDLNAAINIRNWGFENYTAGTAGSACGDIDINKPTGVDIKSLKQEKFIEHQILQD